jgi:hypothetical protein
VPGGSLHLRFLADGDGTGKLLVRAEANGFSGEGGAYFDAAQLEAFARKLGAFPIEGRPSLAGGFWSKTKANELDQELVAIAAYPSDARGHVAVHVRLATELWNGDRPESKHTVSLQLVTSYEPLRHFSAALVALVNGNADEATLMGDV